MNYGKYAPFVEALDPADYAVLEAAIKRYEIQGLTDEQVLTLAIEDVNKAVEAEVEAESDAVADKGLLGRLSTHIGTAVASAMKSLMDSRQQLSPRARKALEALNKTEETIVTENNAFKIVIPFEKMDEDQHLVTGWANVTDVHGTPVVDLQNDVIKDETLVKAAHEFMSQTRAAKAMHQGPDIGEVVESMVLTKDLQKALGIDLGHVGWLITMKINDDATWKRVKSGELKAFSIGGAGKRKDID